MENQNDNFSKITIESYNGTEPFLFVSYSHRDSVEVSRILEYIDKEKFRMWYDDTMEIGEDFREELRSKIEASCGILLFISESSLNSKYCGMEIITAYKYNKRIYPFYLEDDVKIPAALKMILENLQHISGNAAASHKKYLQKLVSSLPIEAMKALHMEGDVLVKCKDGSPEIRIPKEVAAIGNAAFKNCEKLERIIIGENLKSLGSEAFRGCKRLESLDLPETVKKIGDSAFRDCIGLTSVNIVNDEIEIGERAFENCANLSSITLPSGMAEIYGGVFNSCKSLEDIRLPAGLTIIGESSLADCIKIKRIEVPVGVTKIDDMAFNGCIGLEKIILAPTVTKIGKNVFKDCTSLQSITIPASVTAIGTSPFRGCTGLRSITVDPKSRHYKSVDDILFNKNKSVLVCYPAACNQKEFVIPDSVTVISDWAFCDCCFLESIIIPDSVSEIGEGAFYRCEGLRSVELPDSVTKIDDTAFRGCVRLERLVVPDSVKDFGWGVLNGCENVTVICGDHSAAAAYCDRKNIKHCEAL